MKLPDNLLELYKNGWLGVKLVKGSQPIVMNSKEEKCVVNPDRIYLVTYFSSQQGRGIFQIDEDNSAVFDINSDLLEFDSIHSSILN